MQSKATATPSITETTRITLERTKVFSGLPQEVLSTLRLGMERQELHEGDFLFHENEPSDTMFIVRTGTVSLTHGKNASLVEIATRGPGDLVGESAMIDNSPRLTSAVCKNDCRVFVISREKFFEVIVAYPALTEHVLRIMTARVREADIRHIETLQADADLLQQRMHQRERLATKGEMAAEISHELNNFVTALDGYVQLLERDIATETWNDLPRHLSGIRLAHQQIRLFTEGLLHTQHPSGKRAVVQCSDFLAKQVEFIRSLVHFRGLTFETDFEPTNPALSVDTSGLQQVIYGIVTNSYDAMRASRPEVPTVCIASRVDPAGDVVTISISDNGAGIESGLVDRLFRERVSTKATGHGFGLVNAARIITDHGGTIAATNKESGGAVFVITLPIHKA